jgi:tripartite-type tricarboxylate transporter receptor subunit TctC
MRISILAVTISLGALFNAEIVGAQTYPNRPIRLITAEPGTGGDFAARLIGRGLTETIGQPTIIDNRIAVVAADIMSKAPANGYTMMLFGGALWLTPLLQQVSYDPMRDFAPVTLAARAPNVLVVPSSLPVKTVKDLIALAKAKPGELNYASSVNASTSHLAGELFNSLAGTNIVRVTYKGGAGPINDLIVGRVQVMFGTAGSVSALVKSGRLTALAVTTAQPSALFPNLPTVLATIPGYEMASMSGMFVPVKTPQTIIQILNQKILETLGKQEIKDRFFTAGVEVVGSAPGELTAALKGEMARMGKLIKDAGITNN